VRLFAAVAWFCSTTCLLAAGQQPDQGREYAIALTWCGLRDLCHRDAIREADGAAMMSLWRLNMLRFWEGHHYKYLSAGHRLLAGRPVFTGCYYVTFGYLIAIRLSSVCLSA